jgi:two-component system phosphate regulon response regulator PhoB
VSEKSPLVVVIEDEADLAGVLEYNLKLAGFDVAHAAKGREGLHLVQTRSPSLVLLDLMLPDMVGTDVCRSIKSDPATRAIPVMMVTAKGEEVDRVVGFELGADDYVTKPFSVRELILRVRAVLRRGEAPATSSLLRVGPLVLDTEAHRATVEGRELALTALEFRLLHTLLLRRDRVQSRETLLHDVWGLDITVETRTVDTHVKRLREKLGAAGALIETVRGVGYRLTPNPSEEPS